MHLLLSSAFFKSFCPGFAGPSPEAAAFRRSTVQSRIHNTVRPDAFNTGFMTPMSAVFDAVVHNRLALTDAEINDGADASGDM